jgi:colanic acid/amylovoran biosynthesis protein
LGTNPQIETIAAVAWQPSHNKWLSNLRDLFFLFCISFVPGKMIFSNSKFINAFKLIKSSNIVVFTGGRYLNSPYFKAGLSRYLDVLLCRRADVPVVAYSQSVGPFLTLKEKIVADRIINGLIFISPRDEKSVSFLSHFGVPPSKVEFAPDSVFRLIPASRDAAEEFLGRNGVSIKVPGGILIGLSARQLVSMIKSVDDKTKQIYIESLIKYIDDSPRSHRFVFLSSVFRAPGYKRHDPDMGFKIKKSLQEPDRLVVISEEPPAPVLKAAYGIMDLVVTTRMHPIIMCAGMTTPVISIAYEYKCRELMRLINLEEYCIDLNDVTREKLIQLTEKAIHESGSIRSMLESKLPVLQEKALAPAYRIRDILVQGGQKDLRG